MPADPVPDSWSTSQLVEFLAVLSQQSDETAALRAAVERVLESLDAEVGVLFGPHVTPTVVGLDAEAVRPLVAAACAGTKGVDVPGVGECRIAMVALDVDDEAARLLVARAGGEDFVPEEMLLLRGMAWVLHLALRPLRMLATLHERQRMLEQVARVQRAIANRAPLAEVFDTVTDGALGLFGSQLAALYLADQDTLVLASVSTVSDEHRPSSWPLRLSARSGIGRAAYTRGELVRTDDYPASPYAIPELVDRGARAAMAAPVRENGTVVGSLVVVSFRTGSARGGPPEGGFPRGGSSGGGSSGGGSSGGGLPFTDAQEQTLLTFADQVSVALSDAKTLATARHAVRDSVTGLPNRVLFLDRLEQALGRGARAHVLFVDLDRFKQVNDTWGHAAGDDLLRQIARRLLVCLRREDCLARFGGDEYAVLVEDGSAADVCEVAQRLLDAMQAPYPVCGEEIVVGASIGIAAGRDRATAADVLRDADAAMYRAKNAGGGRFVVFDTAVHSPPVRRTDLATDLRHALDRDELSVVFQPIVDLYGGHVDIAEALVRWRHPRRGVVAAGEFIPLAEETGLIVPIGRSVLATACTQAATWPGSNGGPPPAVSVNVSGRQLLDPDLVCDLRQALHATGLPAARLILEIDESAFVSDARCVLDRLHQIRDIGVRLAVDGFGTGYSSLSYLHRFPVDFLKIDHSFVEEVVAGWQRTAFLHTIVRLTQTLSITAVGEGVETHEQLSVLREVGCQFGQGYLFAPPMTAAQFGARLAGCRSVNIVPTAPGARTTRTAPDVPDAAGAPTVPTVPTVTA